MGKVIQRELDRGRERDRERQRKEKEKKGKKKYIVVKSKYF